MSRIAVLPSLDAGTYVAHTLHADDRIWVEKNCYGDLWIELLHALGLDPCACLPFVLGVDFEGDQCTFFKPSHDEMRDLYGIDVQELTVWRPLIDHAVEHLGAGKWISTEADAFWLPDTAGTDYRQQHTKTTIVLNAIDIEGRRLGYFHNAGYFELAGDDFAGLFRLAVAPDPTFLPLFAELIRVDRVQQRSPDDLRQRSRLLLRKHFERRPVTNPVARFAERMKTELPALQAAGLTHYHKWAFASIRQLGAAFELAALHLQWLDPDAGTEYQPAIDAFLQIASANKTLILKAARAVNSGRPLDTASAFAEMTLAWDSGMACLAAHL